MGSYTEKIEKHTKEINFLDYDQDTIIEMLTEVAKGFRSFDERITAFIQEHGYEGNIEDNEEKISFLNNMFLRAGIGSQRNIKNWFYNKKEIEKIPTGYKICFAFKLTVEESNMFFEKICLESGIDCRNKNEAVYFYCLKNGIGYNEAKQIITEVDKIIKGKNTEYEDAEIPLTQTIETEIENFTTIQELKTYLINNGCFFSGYKHKPTDFFEKLWQDISSEEGLANAERLTNFFDSTSVRENNTVNEEIKEMSIQKIYEQILGVDGEKNRQYKKNKSIKSILRDNPMISLFVEKNFPDCQGIDRIINKIKVENDTMRKLLILMKFYSYWIKIAIQNGDYGSEEKDNNRCQIEMDRFLEECGYPKLYYGNPYDWIFLFSMHTDMPLSTFRDFFQTAEWYMNQHSQIQE